MGWVAGRRLPDATAQPGRRRVQHLAGRVERCALKNRVKSPHTVVEEAMPLRRVASKGFPRHREWTAADTELQPSSTQRVQQCRILCGRQWIGERQDEHAGAQSYPRGVLGDRRQHHERARDMLVALAEVALDYPSAVVADLLGDDEESDGVAVGGCGRLIAVEMEQER